MTDVQTIDAAEMERRIRKAAESAEGPGKEALESLESLRQAGFVENTIVLVALLKEAMIRKGDESLVMDFVEWLAKSQHNEPGISSACEDFLRACFDARRDPTGSILTHECGFSSKLDGALPEAIRRLRVLRKLAPGTLCYEKTWGFGVVLFVDVLNKQVQIDFEKRKGHRLSLAYAAETLQLLDESHLLARWHRNPTAISHMVRETPWEIVRLALTDFGPMPVAVLQACLMDRMVAASEWKSFWDAARKELKKQGIVDIPAKRTEAIRLIDKRESFDSAWFHKLANERDMTRILKQIECMLQEVPVESLDVAARTVLADRLDFVVIGAGRRKPGLAGRAILAADAINVLDSERMSEWITASYQPDALRTLLLDLPARHVNDLLVLLGRHDAGSVTSSLLENSNELPLSILNAALDCLEKIGRNLELLSKMQRDFAFYAASPAVLLWFARNLDGSMAEGLVQPMSLLETILRTLERTDLAYEHLRMKNALRDYVEQQAWMIGAFERVGAGDRQELILRLNGTSAWAPAQRQLLVDAIATRFPELTEHIRQKTFLKPRAPERYTSFRSLKERQAQLHKIVYEDVPKNSEDIAHARSFGDLRENFEYKAAREAQELLMRRQSEIELLLKNVQGTDFEGVGAAVAAAGTTVRILHSDGRETIHHILGELDSDEKIGVVSCQSSLAKALIGCRAGDKATIPAETGNDTCTVVDITTISEDIKRWVRGES